MPLTTEQQTQLDYLKAWTSARIDELMPSGSEPNAPYGYIDKELELAAEFILTRAQKHIVIPAAKTAKTTTVVLFNDDEDAKIVLPTDFLRFLRLKMTGWNRVLESLHDTNSREYQRQAFSMSKGTSYHPQAFLVPNSEATTEQSKYAIEAYDAGEGTIEVLDYIPKLASYDIPSSLVDALVWCAASRVLTILRQGEASKQAFDNMLMLLGGKLIGFKDEGVTANG